MTSQAATAGDVMIGLPTMGAIRGHFPALARQHAGRPVAHFDGPGGTQTPQAVVNAISDYLLHHNANTHWNYPTSVETDAIIQHAREAMADFFNAKPNEIAFGNNMTSLTFHISRALARQWGPGDEIVVTELDHYGNVSPWHAVAQDRGLTVRTVPFDPKTGEWIWSEFEKAVTAKTKLVAVGAASNALGTISPVRDAARLARAKGALCYVDAVHYVAHNVTDVKALECDYLACSPYKFYGPHSGAIFARAELMAALGVPKVAPANNEIPERFETGTQNHEGIAGVGAAVEFLASLSQGANRRERLVKTMTAIHARGNVLVERMWTGLTKIKGVTCYGPPPSRPRTPTISFSVAGKTSKEVAVHLVNQGVFVSNGGFYAKDVIAKLGFTGVGLVRAGCALYTIEEEVDRLMAGVRSIAG